MYVERKSTRGTRIGAAILDSICFFSINSFFLILLLMVLQDKFYRNFYSIYIVIFLLMTFTYYTLIPYLTRGRTLGKLLLGIKVISYDYTHAKFYQLLLRNYHLLISFVIIIFYINRLIDGNTETYLFAFILFFYSFFKSILEIVLLFMVLISGEERGLHDLLAKTIVVERDFDLAKLNEADILERKQMTWAVFEDREQEVNPTPKATREDDEDVIEILKKD